MNSSVSAISDLIGRDYKEGFVTEIETDTFPPGLDENVIRALSTKKNEPEFMLDWRLSAFQRWQEMVEPSWAHVSYQPIDFQAISYYSAPRSVGDGPQSLDEVDPKLLETYNKLGISLQEQKFLAGVAVDAVFDSVSVATTFKSKLAEAGVIFCPFSEAVQEHPELCADIWEQLCQRGITSTLPSTRPFSAMAHSFISPRGCVARWSCRHIFELTH